ncbi:MAG TPA: hypothetical protein VFL62_18410 [Bradyrhizobium sp.]|uniref:hypothetical protein n=1 Tax=Bradyrhizobium sp. TaxID=376 RepID=UPI002D802DE2|nr:hypothetical protein [Bradyrhizobium sp.]HET7888199.1 hypothetical protein [Bradyrhizobium sp.]
MDLTFAARLPIGLQCERQIPKLRQQCSFASGPSDSSLRKSANPTGVRMLDQTTGVIWDACPTGASREVTMPLLATDRKEYAHDN